jgi:signal transduction histidine kinase/DNA-binding NarL/FixJ family response regulator
MNVTPHRDDAERNAAEEALRNNDELERRVRERTRELEEANEAMRRSESALVAELDIARRLQEVSTQLIQAEGIEALYEQILDTARAMLKPDFASLQQFHPERGPLGELRLLGFRGFSHEAARFWRWVRPDSNSTCGAALRTGQRVVVPDVSKCDWMAGSDDQAMFIRTGIHAMQSTPLLSRSGAVLGMLSTHWNSPHELSDSKLRGLDVLARLAADLIDRKRAEEASAADLAALTRMHTLSGRLIGLADIEPLLQETIEAAVAMMQADKGTLQLLDGDTLRIAAQHGHERPFLDFFAAAENVVSVCGEATRRGERVVVPDVEASPLFAGAPSLHVLRAAGVRAVQSTPLLTRTGRLLGILTTQWSESFTPDTQALWRLDLLVRQVTDLIEHKQAEAALRQSEKRLAADVAAMARLQELSTMFLHGKNMAPVLAEIVSAAISISDADFGNIQLLEPNSSRLRIAAQQGFPTWWLDFWDGVCESRGVCGTALQRGERVIVEDVLQSPIFAGTDALQVQIKAGVRAVQSTPLMSRSGRLLGMFSTHYKTPRRPDDRALRLLDLLARQTADIIEQAHAEEDLKSAKDAAEAASAAKSQFLANISHELRTPMNAILGLIDVAIPHVNNATVFDCLQTAKESAALLLTLLNDLLDTAKIESGKLELDLAPFSLRGLLDHVTRVLDVRAGEKGLLFECHVPENTPDAVQGDRRRLQQVLLNLAGNAVKFTEQGMVETEVRVADRSESDVLLEFSVRDTGIGIPPEAKEVLFQPFGQADVSLARQFGGTGLGLSISKNLVELMGGRIHFESAPGEGSVFKFTVRLPLASEAPAEIDAPANLLAAACRPLHILLAEDNTANQKLVDYILRGRGHHVEVAGEGEEAVYLSEDDSFDVILMDVQMPGMSGLEAAAVIRRREAQTTTRRVPIIAVTAHAMPSDRERCAEAGMDAYLSKPINAQELIRLVESLGSGATLDAASESAVAPFAEEEAAEDSAAVPVFDPELALARCFESAKMVRAMAETFIAEWEDLLAQMQTALGARDMAELGQLGHRLKGTVAYLGAQPASDAAFRLEQFSLAAAEEAVCELERECAALDAALRAHDFSESPMRVDR